ncbi:MAG: GNAT family N-acetyltransferase [Vicinamibacterales bacterium]|nr:GNAT family N-acetyltransferase [Vicinamibacterales bacterium]
MLPDAVTALIREEQARSGGRFIARPDLDAYLDKLGRHADALIDLRAGRCLGVVAYYANDVESRRAFIPLVLVAPDARGQGLAGLLVGGVLDLCRARGFTRCGLEVRADNRAALSAYRRLGFEMVREREGILLMEVAL